MLFIYHGQLYLFSFSTMFLIKLEFLSQFTKVGVALAGPVASDEPDGNAVTPASFKALVGRGHPEFSSHRQQVDQQESYLIIVI